VSCFLWRDTFMEGGGNVHSVPWITVRRTAAIGDALAATVVADKLKEAGYETEFQSHASIHPLLKYCPNIGALGAPKGYAHVNLDGAYENAIGRRNLHFNTAFLGAANQQLAGLGISLGRPLNCRPTLRLPPELKAIGAAKFSDVRKPWIGVCPASQYYRVRSVPDRIWEAAAVHILGGKIWLGLTGAPKGFADPACRTLSSLLSYISALDLLITVDTGPMHVAAALGVKVLALGQSSSPDLHLNDLNDYQVLWPEGNLDCLNCQENKCPIDVYMPPCQDFSIEKIAELANKMVLGPKISALIPTFGAGPGQLRKCIDNVKNQVDEVIVTVAADGRIVDPLPGNCTIVRSPKVELGFGKNVNFGMRHTTGDWVMLLNDDCYLNSNVLEQLREICAPDVGMIAHLLRYPNGKIYFAGRQRHPGERGFPHLDHNQHLPSVTAVTEMEAVSATSVLINRVAYYNIGGFDERFMMYAEDDDISMRMRQAGYRLLYHPTALGVHEGSATAKNVGNMHAWMSESGGLMEKLWARYYDWNKNRIPGNFDYVGK
jgi:GT2 family glycosyltransferase/ADP-heptose:LPS heptosyltransferase